MQIKTKHYRVLLDQHGVKNKTGFYASHDRETKWTMQYKENQLRMGK